MPDERSAGAIIFYKNAGIIEYLLLQYRHKRWDFPRGHIKNGETEVAAAQREIIEETGLKNLEFVKGFKGKRFWYYKKKGESRARKKQVVYFLARSPVKKVRLDFENLDFKWLPFEQALALPAFPHVKKILQKADDYLTHHKKT